MGKADLAAEIIKLYHNDPISHQVIQYLLSKYKIIPLNAVESITLHREEILLNIVNAYKTMWNARMRIVIKKERGKDESTKQSEQAKSKGKDGANEGANIKEESGR